VDGAGSEKEEDGQRRYIGKKRLVGGGGCGGSGALRSHGGVSMKQEEVFMSN
jgi:hypothetical protein